MLHGHGVNNRRLRFPKKGRQLDLGESRSRTQIVQWNLLLASDRLWVYVCALSADGDDVDGEDSDDDGVSNGDGDHSTRST